MHPVYERTDAVAVWELSTMRTAGPLVLNDQSRALPRAAASLQPGLAERLGLRPDLLAHFIESGSVSFLQDMHLRRGC
jgi:hypothetical protein